MLRLCETKRCSHSAALKKKKKDIHENVRESEWVWRDCLQLIRFRIRIRRLFISLLTIHCTGHQCIGCLSVPTKHGPLGLHFREGDAARGMERRSILKNVGKEWEGLGWSSIHRGLTAAQRGAARCTAYLQKKNDVQLRLCYCNSAHVYEYEERKWKGGLTLADAEDVGLLGEQQWQTLHQQQGFVVALYWCLALVEHLIQSCTLHLRDTKTE